MPSPVAARRAWVLLALLLAAPVATLAQSPPRAYPNPNYGNSWLGSSRPSQTAFRPPTQTYRPAPGAALPTMPVRPSSASTGYATTRPTTSSWGSGPTFASGGYANRMRPTGSALPWVMGALAGTGAAAMLSRNRDAVCNGQSVACYRSACQRAMEQCPSAAGKQLGLVRCPSSPTLPTYTECYTTRDVSFVCLGRPRPTQGSNLDAYCSESSTPTPAPQPRPAAPAPAPTTASSSPSKPEDKPAAAPAPVPYATEDVGVQGAQNLVLVDDTGDAPAPAPTPAAAAPSQQQLQQAQQQPSQQGQQQQDGGGIGTAAFLAAAAGLLLAAGH